MAANRRQPLKTLTEGLKAADLRPRFQRHPALASLGKLGTWYGAGITVSQTASQPRPHTTDKSRCLEQNLGDSLPDATGCCLLIFECAARSYVRELLGFHKLFGLTSASRNQLFKVAWA
jgi:hypothetical protein